MNINVMHFRTCKLILKLFSLHIGTYFTTARLKCVYLADSFCTSTYSYYTEFCVLRLGVTNNTLRREHRSKAILTSSVGGSLFVPFYIIHLMTIGIIYIVIWRPSRSVSIIARGVRCSAGHPLSRPDQSAPVGCRSDTRRTRIPALVIGHAADTYRTVAPVIHHYTSSPTPHILHSRSHSLQARR